MKDAAILPMISPEEGLRLCGGNSALYLRALRRFAGDPTVSFLKSSLACADLSSAFLHAHTLKGLCAQLALPALKEKADALCRLLRPQETTVLPDAAQQLDVLVSLHQKTLKAVDAFLSCD